MATTVRLDDVLTPVIAGVPVWLEPCLPEDEISWLPSFPSIGVFCGVRAFEKLMREIDRDRLIDIARD